MPQPRPAASLRPLLACVPVALAWLFLYRDEFGLLYVNLNGDDYSYGFLAPLVAGYFAWQDRKGIAGAAGGPAWPGLLALVAAGFLLVAGRMGSLETFIFLSMWLSVGGIALTMLGWRALPALVFPLLLLLFVIPPPGFVEQVLSFNLRLASSALAGDLLQLLNVPVFREGNIIDLGSIRLQVVEACSGLRYFLPTLLLSLLVGKFFNKRLISRALVVLSSVPISLGLNAIRITVTGILVRYVSPTLASGFFHDFQGWVIYLATIVLLAAASFALRPLDRRGAAQPVPSAPPAPEAAGGPGAADAALAEPPAPEPAPQAQAQTQERSAQGPGLLAAGAATALLLLSALALWTTAGSQIIPAWKPLSGFPMEIGPWRGTPSTLDKETLEALGCDDYVLASYRSSATGRLLTLMIPFYKAQTAKHTAHAPTSCMLGSGWDLTAKREIGPSPATGRNFPVKQMLLGKGSAVLLSNFWFQQRGRIIDNEFANKLYLLYDALAMRRTDGALVRVEMLLPPGTGQEEGQAELDAFTGQVREILKGFLPE